MLLGLLPQGTYLHSGDVPMFILVMNINIFQ